LWSTILATFAGLQWTDNIGGDEIVNLSSHERPTISPDAHGILRQSNSSRTFKRHSEPFWASVDILDSAKITGSELFTLRLLRRIYPARSEKNCE
jgi:hypothetical protein